VQRTRAILQQAVTETSGLPKGYAEFLEDLKTRIRAARIKAALSANRELILLYWDIGKSIVERQRKEGWGRSVVERLARDLQAEFPGISGFSPQNMWYMRAFYLAGTLEVANLQQPVGELDGENLPQAVGEIPWGHNLQYALRDTRKPMGVAAYRLTTSLPKHLKGSLPTIEDLEAELGAVAKKTKSR
jgi:predicted nuclease of restriction endonuclease-like (RecB) superfamily